MQIIMSDESILYFSVYVELNHDDYYVILKLTMIFYLITDSSWIYE